MIFFISLLFPIFTHAQVSQNFMNQTQPLYEAGLGAITLNVPDYPGSSNNRFRVVPFPYYIFRGKYLRSDDEGARARIFSSRYHEIGFSGGFNFPVNSGDNPSRMGMPDLDALFGVGPRLLLRLLSRGNHQFNFSIATRAMFTTDFKSRLRGAGFSIEPYFSYWYRMNATRTTLVTNLSFDFGTAELTRFFYNVTPEFSNASRSEYTARAGLIERTLSLGITQLIHDNFTLFSVASWRNLDHSTNRDSPLVARKDNFAVLLGFIWMFYESETTVQRHSL